MQAAGGSTRATSASEAVNGADAILLAAPFHSAQELINSLPSLEGKVLIDATNPLGEGLRLQTWPASSAAEQIAGWARGARVVKAFNMTGSGNMSDPSYGATQPAMLLCGDDPAAKALVAGLANEIGFEAVDCGALSAANLLEAAAGLWVRLAYLQGMGPNIALALLRK